MDDLSKACAGMNQMSTSIKRSFEFRVLNAIKNSSGKTEDDLMLCLSLPHFAHYKKSLRDAVRTLVIQGKVARRGEHLIASI